MFGFESDTGGQRIPVTVLAGAASAGKTAIATRIAAERAAQGVLSIVNAGPDGRLPEAGIVERIEGRMVPHAVGCLCCVGRSGLTDALRRQYSALSRAMAAFGAVLVECAAGEDPAPVLQTLLNNALVTQYYRLDGLVAVVDGSTPPGNDPAWVKTIAMADRIAVTRCTGSVGQPALLRRLAEINPSAAIVRMDTLPEVAPALTGAGWHDCIARNGNLDEWLGGDLLVQSGEGAAEGGLFRFAVELPGALDWEGFHAWLDTGVRANGDLLFRIRGVVDLEGVEAPVLVQAVQQVLEPPVRLSGWSGIGPGSRLSFVTRELGRSVVQESLNRDLPVFSRQACDRALRRVRALADPSFPA